MFSEYASRFLAQSSSRISNFVQPDSEAPPRNPSDRFRRTSQITRAQNRQYLGRQTLGNPYLSASHLSNFPFASRLSATPDAPLFQSTLDEFREEDDEEEHEREITDHYALARSRRAFGTSRFEESSETDADGSIASIEEARDADARIINDRGRGRGIKSSWNGGMQSIGVVGKQPDTVGEELETVGKDGYARHSSTGSSGRRNMVDIGLESTIHDSDPPDDLAIEMPAEDSSPAFQQFRSLPKTDAQRLTAQRYFLRQKRDLEAGSTDISRPASIETVPPTVPAMIGEPPRHDVFWSSLYLICLAALFASFFLVFLHTSTPSGKKPLGDTIYTTLQSSFYLLAVDTLISVIVSLVWLALLRSFVRPLVYLILLAVPVILFSFSLYPLISSYGGTKHGASFQDRVMRWLSFAPAIFAAVWVYTVYKGRHSLTKAIGILEFSSRILASNPALLPLGFGTLVAVIIWTWMWLGMFTRVFLGGHTLGGLFVINASAWWLGMFFVILYLWTLAVFSGIQRATTAATVSQWYFHRNVEPSPTSRDIVLAAFIHATTTLFGSVCFSSLMALLIRLPLLILPRRLVGLISLFAYSFVPTPVAALINPLTLTYAAVQSSPLQISARDISQMSFISPSAPTTTLTPRSFSSRTQNTSSPLLPYRLAKLLLHATRFIMATALGFGGWIATARQLSIDAPGGTGIKGSAYAYVVGLVASFIGWGVLGAIEGILSGIVDASVVCWGIDKSTAGGGSYCLEAGYLFGDRREERVAYT